MALEALYIVDEMAEVVARVKTALNLEVLNFLYGEDEHIIKAMKDMKKESEEVYNLIAMVLPVDIEKGASGGYYGKAIIPRIVFAKNTNPAHPPSKRMDDVIKTHVHPIYERFLAELKKQARTFVIMGDVKHTMRIRFGTQTAAQGFTEYIDGIEVLNMELTLKNNHCS